MNSIEFIHSQIDTHIELLLNADENGFENTLDKHIKTILMLILEQNDENDIINTTQYLCTQLGKKIPALTYPNVPKISVNDYYPTDTMPYIYLSQMLHINDQIMKSAFDISEKFSHDISKVKVMMPIFLPKFTPNHNHHIPIMLNNKLCFYSYKDSLKMVKNLLDEKADINCENGLPLLFAVSNNSLSLTQFLIEQGANLHFNQDEAFRLAVYQKQYDILDLFLKKDLNFSLKYLRCINHYEQETLTKIQSIQLNYKLNLDLADKDIIQKNKI